MTKLPKKIKVIHLCSSVSYCTAAFRISQALQMAEINSEILCCFSDVAHPMVTVIPATGWWKFKRKAGRYLLLLCTKKLYKMGKNGPFSLGVLGNPKLLQNQKLKEADIIHLHWINDGMLSIKDLKKLGKLGKPLVITTHDMWFMTGGCHVSNRCNRFIQECGSCKVLGSRFQKDISYIVLRRKKKAWSRLALYITSPSSHTHARVKKSSLFKDRPSYVIPNTLDISKFRHINMDKKGNEITILFGAAYALLPHKGFSFLLEALDIFRRKYPHKQTLRLLVLGKGISDLKIDGYIVEYAGYLDNEESMCRAYSRASVFIVPSLEDTFNQSVAEAMACKTPVVAFEGVGITDIIDHKVNGYLAKYRDSEDLADGIEWVLSQNPDRIGLKAREKVFSTFSYEVVGKQFKKLYEGILDGQVR